MSNSKKNNNSICPTLGRCCYCNDECNPMSQTCGRCPREFNGAIFGWNEIPIHFIKTLEMNRVKDAYYNIVAGNRSTSETDELRDAVNANVFIDIFPFDTKYCDIDILLKWVGQQLV